MKLTIVIPALNEEQAIGSTIERCLAARTRITQSAPVSEVEIIVVSDGSTDRTVEIAAGYDGIRVIVFEQNRGYGAAIKRGFEESTGDLVGFLDADGTCDPGFFAPLCTAIVAKGASVAIGSRLGPSSRMPRIRRLGNRVYALILSALSNKVVTDTASGMRVIQKDALSKLYPLPDGLHFTPAMSARVLMDDELSIIELPMAYEERIGESKLHVLRDGVRFLQTILHMTMMWRPAKLLVGSAVLCLLVMVLLAMHPIEMWLSQGRLEESMVYRLLFCSLLGTVGTMLLSAGVLADRVHTLVTPAARPASFVWQALHSLFALRGAAVASLMSALVLAWLVGPGFWTRITLGYVDLHWSRVVLAGMIAFCLAQMWVTVVLANIIGFHTARALSQSAERTLSGSAADAETANTPTPKPVTPLAAKTLANTLT